MEQQISDLSASLVTTMLVNTPYTLYFDPCLGTWFKNNQEAARRMIFELQPPNRVDTRGMWDVETNHGHHKARLHLFCRNKTLNGSLAGIGNKNRSLQFSWKQTFRLS